MPPTPTRVTDAGLSIPQQHPQNTLASQEAGTAGLQAQALPFKKKSWKKHTHSPKFWLSLAGLFILWALAMGAISSGIHELEKELVKDFVNSMKQS